MSHRPTVLIVEDNQTTLNIASEMLEAEGYAVQPAQDLITMSVWLERRTFDLVLLDEMMPDLLGHDLVPYLKHGLKLTVPIVLCSGLDPYKIKRLVEKCGADGMIYTGAGLKGFSEDVKKFLSPH